MNVSDRLVKISLGRELYSYWDMCKFAVYLPNFSSNMDKIPHTRCPQNIFE
jgi:hypothetical protein